MWVRETLIYERTPRHLQFYFDFFNTMLACDEWIIKKKKSHTMISGNISRLTIQRFWMLEAYRHLGEKQLSFFQELSFPWGTLAFSLYSYENMFLISEVQPDCIMIFRSGSIPWGYPSSSRYSTQLHSCCRESFDSSRCSLYYRGGMCIPHYMLFSFYDFSLVTFIWREFLMTFSGSCLQGPQ